MVFQVTSYHSQYWAHLLTLRRNGGSIENLTQSIAGSRVDLNPHQVDAALFALRSPLSHGVVLADEVGLGKTIEAGIVLAQRWAQRKRRILLILPATLRNQWQQELEEKFFLPSMVLDGPVFNRLKKAGTENPFLQDDQIVICSYHFASSKAKAIAAVPWDQIVIDEAHRMRNVYKDKDGKSMAGRITEAVGSANKLLLTATPLQNSLMELYGLISVIDEHVFGDAASFQDQFVRNSNEQQRNRMLKDRLAPVCIRTLRKQVGEYVPYTSRIPITQDFTPSDDEQRLYDSVSAFLQRETLVSLPASQRQLITLVLRKLLASSTFAISATLRRLVGRLEDKIAEDAKAARAAIGDSDGDGEQLIEPEDYEPIGALADEWSADREEGSEEPASTTSEIGPGTSAIQSELAELMSFSSLAEGITENAKGDALLPALKTALSKAVDLGAQRKAVIFTESRRTQDYLFKLLADNGYDGELVLMNGENDDPLSRQIYRDWRDRHAGESRVSGSKAVDVKTAIVEAFRDSASILIATEAAAEGVNLQFCSLVVNFDLPWNPQRVEQRIGRCHRYGQKHDVVVLNLLNRANEADQRVFELLSEKFQLFDGVFGASDQVLGALESGVDIERRIAAVYQTCRSPAEIAAAFESLQSDLEEQIGQRMEDTRQMLLENFDEQVTERLKVFRDQTLESLDQRQRWLLNLTKAELGDSTDFDPSEPRFTLSKSIPGSQLPLPVSRLGASTGSLVGRTFHFDWKKAESAGEGFYRTEHPLADALITRAWKRDLPPVNITLDYGGYGGVIAVLEPLIGQSGWLQLTKLTIETLDREEFLLLVGATEDGENVDTQQCEKLLQVPATVNGDATLPLPDLSTSIDAEQKRCMEEVDQRNAELFDQEALKLDHWSDDLKQGLEREIKEMDSAIKEARKVATAAETLAEKLEAQKTIKSLEKSRKEKRKRLYEAQDDIDDQRDELIERVQAQLEQRVSSTEIFTIRWTLEGGQ